MACLQIVGLKRQLTAAVHTLRGLGCVHIEDLGDAGVSARPLRLEADLARAHEELGSLVARIEGLLAVLLPDAGRRQLLEQAPADGPGSDGDEAAQARAAVAALNLQVMKLVSRQEALEAEQTSLPRYVLTLRRLLPIVPPAAHDAANASVGVLVSVSVAVAVGVEVSVAVLVGVAVEVAVSSGVGVCV